MINYDDDFNVLTGVFSIKINDKVVYQKEHICMWNLLENDKNMYKLPDLQLHQGNNQNKKNYDKK